jgi:16S rRNA A1518/A1519 N6-dimethyltransferase RsmA/KsgA/DIM1 with predicted DNA glycosylase/AP lyase activity
MIAAGIMEKQYIIWVKNAPVLGHADYQWSHEPCYYAEKAGIDPTRRGETLSLEEFGKLADAFSELS